MYRHRLKDISGNVFDMFRYIDLDFFEKNADRKKEIAEKCVIISHIHCLPSIIPMFEYLIDDVGVDPVNIIIADKSYSTIKSVLERLKRLGVRVLPTPAEFEAGKYDEMAARILSAICWRGKRQAKRIHQNSRIVLLDDGGMLTSTWLNTSGTENYDAVSIQQTTSGMTLNRTISLIPRINVAQSAAKGHFESHVISSGVCRKAQSLLGGCSAESVGIVGFGVLGKAIALNYLKLGKRIYYYDIRNRINFDHGALNECSSAKSLIERTDVIFGVTGKTWFNQDLFESMDRKRKYFLSCSSRDVEFKDAILKNNSQIRKNNIFGNFTIRNKNGGEAKIFNGGFPVNFDRRQEWEFPEEIALTRGLILISILQAIFMKNDEKVSYRPIELSPEMQKQFVHHWIDLCGVGLHNFPISKENFADLGWWQRQS